MMTMMMTMLKTLGTKEKMMMKMIMMMMVMVMTMLKTLGTKEKKTSVAAAPEEEEGM